MTPEQIEELARQIVTQGLPIDWKVYVVMGLLSLAGAAIGAAIAGYYSKRGEIKAIHDQIEKVEEQTRRIASVTEREKSLAWLDQKRWDLRRDFYWELLAVINALSNVLRNMRGLLQPDKFTPEKYVEFASEFTAVARRAQEQEDALARIFGIGRILLSENVVTLLDSYQKDLKQLETESKSVMNRYQRPKSELDAMSDFEREQFWEKSLKELPVAMTLIVEKVRNRHHNLMPEIIRAARKDLLSLSEVNP